MNKNIQIYKLDGGMLFELNKLFGDIGTNAILHHKETIINNDKTYFGALDVIEKILFGSKYLNIFNHF